MYPTYIISKDQADKIINVEENFLNDVKAKEIRPAKLSETVSAFANAGGGDIYIGISEVGENKNRLWKGFADVEEANDMIQALVQAHLFANHIIFEFLSCSDYEGYVLHLTIKKVKEIVKSTKGEIFLRVNAGKIKLDTTDRIARLELDKGIITFEDEWVNITPERVENSVAILDFLINVVPSAEPLTYLNNQELLKHDQCKVAGVLLFCDEPAIYLPKRCSIKIMRYRTKDNDIGREFLDGVPLTIEGNIYDVIYRAVDKSIEIIEGVQKLGTKGMESVLYPKDTIHEIITNAVLHRDYSIAADSQIRIFDNRVEVESPGKLPGHVTKYNILDTQSARNPTIVRLINKFPNPPNQDVGEGLNTAFSAMEALRLKPPVIDETENSVLITIPHEPLSSPEELVIEYLQQNPEITNRVARDITGIKSENIMKNVFLRLKGSNVIEPVPNKGGSASAWQIKSS
ncbi:ATP-binding protein [uncultured Psychrobacter sp.]|uniref:ATP-binding protein n=1 Tax=uncultured Psychrobacter sp. TaxID=259303 RepID=UPI003458F2B6